MKTSLDTASRAAHVETRSIPAALSPSSTLGDWQLVRLVGEGSLARVYQARPIGTSVDHPADYAVKVLRRQRAAEAHLVEGLQLEAAVGRRVQHAHLASVFEVEIEHPTPYLVMPLIAGVSIRQMLERGHRPALVQALWMTRQLAEALEALHSAGWRHADVKPENVIVSATGHATLIDLGSVAPLGRAASPKLEMFAGTLRYAAPELFSSSVPPGATSDLYSLGVLLFELLAGRPPFAGDSPRELAVAHLEYSPPDLRRLLPQLPLEVTTLVRNLLAKQPLRRPHTAREVAHQLMRLEIELLETRLAHV